MNKLSPQEIEEIRETTSAYPRIDISRLLSHIESQDKEIAELKSKQIKPGKVEEVHICKHEDMPC